jgi:5'-nucleotidase / UDP-sugar diphosphatase
VISVPAPANAGGYLQRAGVARDGQGNWLVNGAPLDDNRTYQMAVNDFLLSGREQNLGFFSSVNPEVRAQCVEGSDIRRIFKDYLAGRHPRR